MTLTGSAQSRGAVPAIVNVSAASVNPHVSFVATAVSHPGLPPMQKSSLDSPAPFPFHKTHIDASNEISDHCRLVETLIDEISLSKYEIRPTLRDEAQKAIFRHHFDSWKTHFGRLDMASVNAWAKYARIRHAWVEMAGLSDEASSLETVVCAPPLIDYAAAKPMDDGIYIFYASSSTEKENDKSQDVYLVPNAPIQAPSSPPPYPPPEGGYVELPYTDFTQTEKEGPADQDTSSFMAVYCLLREWTVLEEPLLDRLEEAEYDLIY